MTSPDLKAMREAAVKATPGPWEAAFRFGQATLVQTPGNYPIAITDIFPRSAGVDVEQQANAAHIALWNPANALALIDRLEEVERERDEARKMLDLYDAPTNDEGEGAGPLSVAGRIEAMVYAKAVQADASRPPLLDKVEKALEPFARIAPSSFYAADGSEAEGYCVFLAASNASPVAFTGEDLARARQLLEELRR